MQRAQGLRYKYTDRWLSTDNRKFLFRSQTRDNMFWSVVSGGGFWSAYEVATLWAYANGLLPWLALRSNPVFFVLLLLAIPVIRDLDFYAVHRLLHWKPLYRAAHYVHHKNVNVGPWSGLAMHPIEHLLYFSGVLLHWVLPSHPLHALFHLQHAAFSPAAGHSGFEATEFGHESAALVHGSYFHYLHHRYFECNYAGDNAMVLDRFFGSLHNRYSRGPRHDARPRPRPHAHPQGDRLAPAPAPAPADACYSRQESKGLCAVSSGRVTRAPARCDACAAIAHSTWRRAVLPSSSSYSGSRPSMRSISALAMR